MAANIAVLTIALFPPGAALAAGPYLTLQPGYTQELYGTAPGFMGGVAFAPDGDVLVTPCTWSGGGLTRFDAQTAAPMGGGMVHPHIGTLPSNSGCGLTNHPDGTLYSNTNLGIVRLDANTGAQIGLPMGPAGNPLGITVDPQTNNVVYVGEVCRFTGSCPIYSLDPTTGIATMMANVAGVDWVDGLYFNPDGTKLFLATRAPLFALTVLNRDGSVDMQIPLPSEPDGIAFHLSGRVVTNNTDGSITSVDLSVNPAVVETIATGGFRGDLSQVGADGCMYNTQDGTRFADGTTSWNNSVVRVCPDFSPPPGVSRIVQAPLLATLEVGMTHTVTAAVTHFDGSPVADALVTFDVVGANPATLTATTDTGGLASVGYVGTSVGNDTIRSGTDVDGTHAVSGFATATWEQPTNLPPVANAGMDQTVECTGPDGATITVDGSGSNDPDGDAIMLAWSGPFGTATGVSPSVPLPLGVNLLTLTVTDANGETATDTVTVTVGDTVPPTVGANLMPFGDGDEHDDSDEGRFIVMFSALDTCDPNPVITANLMVPGTTTSVAVGNGDAIEFEVENDGVEIETELSDAGQVILEIEGPALILNTVATDAAGNSASASAEPPGLGIDNEGSDDLSDD